jgi:predicted RNase H-like nuclease (RuvC/YqgF family)
MEGVFENLEQLVAWSPAHHTQKLERELSKQTNEVARLQQQIRNMLEIIDDDTKQKTELHNEVERLMEELQRLKSLAQAVVDRWETPAWKDAEPTASVIYRLRDALAPASEEPVTEESSLTE